MPGPSDEALFRGILEAAPDAVVITSKDGRIELVNGQTEQLFGYRREELIGHPVEVLIPEAVRAAHVEHRGRYVASPRTRPMGAGLDLWARRKDGSQFPVEISLSPLRSRRGLHVISIIRDVTERRRWEEVLARRTLELEQSNAELQQFAYVASHDLQEPLRMVVSFLQLLQRRYAGQLDAEANEYIQFAVDGGRRMQALIQDLLEYSRVGNQELQLGPVDLDEVVDSVLRELSPTIDECKAEITRDALPRVIADPVQIGRLYQNLISNGLKFQARGNTPRVHLGAQRVADAWVLSVSDNGIGIEPDQTERIFRIFQRLHTQDEYPGTGIGLAICRRIVERHGGRIWVDSTPGKGAVFSFTLPLEDE